MPLWFKNASHPRDNGTIHCETLITGIFFFVCHFDERKRFLSKQITEPINVNCQLYKFFGSPCHLSSKINCRLDNSFDNLGSGNYFDKFIPAKLGSLKTTNGRFRHQGQKLMKVRPLYFLQLWKLKETKWSYFFFLPILTPGSQKQPFVIFTKMAHLDIIKWPRNGPNGYYLIFCIFGTFPNWIDNFCSN